MRKGLWVKLLAIAVTLAVLAGAAAYGSRGRMTNFDEVRGGVLYRSGQPREDSWDLLVRHYRIRTVISLRENRPEADWWKQEESACSRLGLKMIHIPLETRDRPTPQEWNTFLQAVTEPANWPILVHCEAGSSRTGVMVAGYEVFVLRKNLRKALSNAKDHHFDAKMHPDYVAFLEDLIKARNSATSAPSRADEED